MHGTDRVIRQRERDVERQREEDARAIGTVIAFFVLAYSLLRKVDKKRLA
jgi:hypothetical protein